LGWVLSLSFYKNKVEILILMKNDIFLLNKMFKITIRKYLVYTYINTQLWIKFIFMVYIIGLIFEAQINLMWFLEEFKVSEILSVATFNTICTFNFDTKCLHRTMETFVMC
jgi:hypothetical protein